MPPMCILLVVQQHITGHNADMRDELPVVLHEHRLLWTCPGKVYPWQAGNDIRRIDRR